MIFDGRSALRFALRVIAFGALLGFGALVGVAVAWRWPLNFAGAIGLVLMGYCAGRVHSDEISTRPTQTIAPLPRASARSRSDD